MMELYDRVSFEISRKITQRYSTSFSLGIRMLHRRLHNDIFAIYGFVRVADEVVDTFYDYPAQQLLDRFEVDTFTAIEEGISTNPVLHAFQKTVNRFDIDHELIRTFLRSMRMDLSKKEYDDAAFKQYVLGSAEVVGLMCLKVFVQGDQSMYDRLRNPAMKLGSAFQKVNFLRDLRADYCVLGRIYFPGLQVSSLTQADKQQIEASIAADFKQALEGIRQLPAGCRLGVYSAYKYYWHLFLKIRRTPIDKIMERRIRISNLNKLFLLARSYVRLSLGAI